MRRSPARPEAAFRGLAAGAVSFGAAFTAHALAMHGAVAAGGHAMASMAAVPAGSSTPAAHAMPALHGAHAMHGAHAGHAMPATHAIPDAAASAVPAASLAAPTVPATSVLLLAAVCAVLGLLAARPRSASARATGAMLLLGQGAGHLALGVTMGHLAMSPSMAVAHVAAAVLAGAAIAGAERALRLALAVLVPLAATWRDRTRTVALPAWAYVPTPVPALARHGALRGPPA
ncbi:hypothetical protein [Tsukamurella sp. PLM1]|uniref:hypothetical protein n=1 Tax=Tsukamurella sp. PLM1 TaxID=2929795 RepID=UPI002065B3C5|nr:hypothetical protein [Tsukamurella sp. PLM1]BDH59528.1 hypothetical protein MTP03_44670 [Tsukamurella sp. PLM1]